MTVSVKLWQEICGFTFLVVRKLKLKVVSLKPGVSIEAEADGLCLNRIPLVLMNTTFSFNFWYHQKCEIHRFLVKVFTEYRHLKLKKYVRFYLKSHFSNFWPKIIDLNTNCVQNWVSINKSFQYDYMLKLFINPANNKRLSHLESPKISENMIRNFQRVGS